MFGRSRKRIAELEAQLRRLIEATENMRGHAYLSDVKKEGRLLKFMFVRNGELHVVETMSTISLNASDVRKKLIE